MAACCSGEAIREISPPSSSGLWPARKLFEGPLQRLHELLGIGIEPAHGPFDQREEMTPDPRNSGELSPVGDLMDGQPQAKLARIESVSPFDRHDVRTDVVDDVLVIGVLVLNDQLVVLAEDTGRQPSEHQADLGAGHLPRQLDGHRAPAAGLVHSSLELVDHRAKQTLKRRYVGIHPLHPVGHPGPCRADQ